MKTAERRLELMPLKALTGAVRNPKRHSPDIAKSIGRFGYVEPIVLDERTKRLVAGHGRMDALRGAQRAGEAPPQGVVVKGREWLVPVIRGWASRSDAEAEAYLIASNRLTEDGGWNSGELAELLQALNAQGALEGTGFDLAAIDQVLKAAALEQQPLAGNTDPDEVPTPKTVTVESGDVYQLGAHRLACGDSTTAGAIDAVMQGALADCMATDPPYGVEYEGKAGTIANDGAAGLPALLRGAFAQVVRVLKPGGFAYVAHPAGPLALVFYEQLAGAGLQYRQGLVWVKDALVLGHADYHYRHEPIIYATKPGSGRRGRGGPGWYGDNAQTSVLEFPRPKSNDEHPTMKPVALYESFIGNSTGPGHLVFEPFSGSGTTLIACERLRRACRAVELSPRFVQVAIERWEAFTGQRAELVSRGGLAPKTSGRHDKHRRARRR